MDGKYPIDCITIHHKQASGRAMLTRKVRSNSYMHMGANYNICASEFVENVRAAWHIYICPFECPILTYLFSKL